MHLFDRLGPGDQLQIIEQPFRISGDAQEPLAEGHTHNRETLLFGFAILYFFVGQNGPQGRTPIDGDFRLVRQPFAVAVSLHRCLAPGLDLGRNRQLADGPAMLPFPVVPSIKQLQENPLRPLVIFWIRGIDLSVPVITEAEYLDLAPEGINVFAGRQTWMGAGLDGVFLRRQPEGIPAHRMQNISALHAQVATEDIRSRVSFRMPDVQPRPRRIRKHVEDVGFRLVGDI